VREKQKRVLSRVIAGVCIITLLITGSYAWRGISEALNQFDDRKIIDGAGANLHDDFLAETGEKEVYVENTGDEDVYVRIQLSDLLVENTDFAPAYPSYELFKPGDLTQAGNQYGKGFIWTFGNSTDYDYTSITGSAEWATAADRSEADTFVGDQRGNAASGSTIVDLAGLPNDRVAPAGSVISMVDYWDLAFDSQRDEFAGWVYDADGYAYWSQVLPPGRATSLLLNGVVLPSKGDSTYYYAINVDMEYVDTTDLAAWIDGVNIQTGADAGQKAETPTAEAIDMLKGIRDRRSNWAIGLGIGDVFMASGWEWIVIGLDGSGNALVQTKDMVGTTPFNLTASTPNNYVGSNLDEKMKNFYTHLKAYDVTTAGNRITEVAQPSDYATKLAAVSSVTSTGAPTCFALSLNEAYTFCNNRPDLWGAKATAKIADGFDANWYPGTTVGDLQEQMTRTTVPQGASIRVYAIANPPGTWMNTVTDIDHRIGARPSLWINVQ
jgi:hypothetical protein